MPVPTSSVTSYNDVANDTKNGDTFSGGSLTGHNPNNDIYPALNPSGPATFSGEFLSGDTADYFVIDVAGGAHALAGAISSTQSLTFRFTTTGTGTLALGWRLASWSNLQQFGPGYTHQFYLSPPDGFIKILSATGSQGWATEDGTGVPSDAVLEFQVISYGYTGQYTITVSTLGGTSRPVDEPDRQPISVNQNVDGILDPAGDRDAYSVQLTAGTTYTFDLTGDSTIPGDISDPYLRIYNSAGILIAQDDDSGPGTDAQITFTPTTTATYLVEAASFNDQSTGPYRLRVASGSTTPPAAAPNDLRVTLNSINTNTGIGNPANAVYPGGQVILNYTLSSTFATPQGVYVQYYVSPDPIISTSDRPNDDAPFLGTVLLNAIPANGSLTESGALMRLPSDLAPGDYYVGVIVDFDNQTAESNENNNASAGSLIHVVAVPDAGRNLVGTAGPNTIVGGNGPDMIDAGGGNDNVSGGLGNDVIFAGPGDDSVGGGPGNDIILGQDGNDVLGGDASNDRINGGPGNDVIFGGPGNDELGGGTGDDIIVGQDGNDVMFGEAGADHINGGTGDDIAVGGADNDEIGGGDGNDTLVGDDGDDILFGESGADHLSGGFGNDVLVGGSGTDELGGDAGDDVLVGGDGDDVIFAGVGNDRANGGDGNDILIGSDGQDELGGGAGDDNIQGGFGNDTMFGEAGSDILEGGAGDDVSIGGAGDDRFVFRPGDGNDRILDFAAGGAEDRVWFVGTNLTSFDQAQAAATFDAVQGGTLISYNGGSVFLAFVSPGQLTADDFIFS